jgi:hypothetical protein
MSVTHDQAAGMATAGALAKGYLLKHNRDHRSTNILPVRVESVMGTRLVTVARDGGKL